MLALDTRTQAKQEPALPDPRQAWLVVSQVKSHRVVYFTDDASYQPPTDGDWYYVSEHRGALPEGMTLRNCWGWRFNGMAFIDAREAPKPKPAQALLDNNKQGLQQLLKDKINALRKPWSPSVAMGDQLRVRKLREAESLLRGEASEADLRFLPTLAAIRGCSVRDMASQIIDLASQTEEVLESTELLREELSALIESAASLEELTPIRLRLIGDLQPELGIKKPLKPANTTPADYRTVPTQSQLAQEQIRLQVLLRLNINRLRRGYVSDYLLDDVVLKHKGRLAQEVLKAGGDIQKFPKGLDAVVLISHAASRGLTLIQAATEILQEMNDAARILLETEQMKDAILSRIASVDSFKSIDVLAQAIQRLQLQPVPATVPAAAPASNLAANAEPLESPRPPTDFGKRRVAILAASRKASIIKEVSRVSSFDVENFRSRALEGLPFILSGAVSTWPLASLTPDALVRTWGHLPVRARVGDYVEKAFTKDRQLVPQSLAAYLSQIKSAAPGAPHDWPAYLGNQKIPELAGLCTWPHYFAKTAEPRIWLGPAGTVTPLHCDYDDNLFAQLWGRKRFVLFAPHEEENLYVSQANPALLASAFNPDRPDYAAMPKARKALAIECTVEPGDLLFVPAGWFHQVHALTLSLSANLWAYDPPLALQH